MDFSETEKTEEERKYPRYYIMRLEELVKTRQQRINQLESLCRQLAEACKDSLRRVNDLDCECDSYEGFVCGKHGWKQALEVALEAAKKVLGE